MVHVNMSISIDNKEVDPSINHIFKTNVIYNVKKYKKETYEDAKYMQHILDLYNRDLRKTSYTLNI